MSAYWSNNQVSVCATAHFFKKGQKTFQYNVLCLDDMGLNKDSIYYYNNYILKISEKKL